MGLGCLLLLPAGGGLDIGEVRFAGNVAIPTNELASLVETARGLPYRSEVVASDERRVERLYRERGYLEATVSHKRSLLGELGALRITFLIEEGEPMIIASCEVEGNRSLASREISGVTAGLNGKPLNIREVAAAARELRALYVRGTHPYAAVYHEVAADTISRTASLVFRVVEGPGPVIAGVTIEGLRDVKPGVVLREIHVAPGDPYDGQELRRSRYRIHELGLFRSVVFVLPGMETAQENLQLIVRAEEAPARWVEVATGYGSPDRVRVAVAVGHDNVFGMARSISLRGQLSYGWRLERFVGRIEGAVRDPWAAGLPIAAGVEIFVEERREMGSHFRKFGGALRVGRRWTERTESSVICRYERRRTMSLSTEASDELKEETERETTNSVVASQRFDLRDSPVEPSVGGIFTLTGREAGGILGGDNDFRMLTGEVAWFHPIARGWIAGGRARLGLARPFGASGSVPFEERFRAGGAHTVRGYPEEGLGPLDENGEPLGGEQVALVSVEARFPVRGKLWGGAFLDGGEVWADAGEARLRDLAWGAGLGLRYLTFVGPLRLDWAAPIPTGKGRVYVALGHAF